MRRTDTESETGRGIERGTTSTVSTSRKATNAIAAAAQRGQRTRSAAVIADPNLKKRKKRGHGVYSFTDSWYYGMTMTYTHV